MAARAVADGVQSWVDPGLDDDVGTACPVFVDDELEVVLDRIVLADLVDVAGAKSGRAFDVIRWPEREDQGVCILFKRTRAAQVGWPRRLTPFPSALFLSATSSVSRPLSAISSTRSIMSRRLSEDAARLPSFG